MAMIVLGSTEGDVFPSQLRGEDSEDEQRENKLNAPQKDVNEVVSICK